MTALIVIAAVLLFFTAIALLPIYVRIVYDDELRVYIPLAFFKIKLYPRKPRLKSMSQKKFLKLLSPNKKKKQKQSKAAAAPAKKDKLSPGDIIPLISEIKEHAVEIIARLLTKQLRVKIYKLKINVSTDDAAKTAVAYGAVCTAAASLMALLEENCLISYSAKAQTGVYCDYLSGVSGVAVNIRFRIRVGQLISQAFNIIKKIIIIKNKTEANKNDRNKNKRHNQDIACKHQGDC